MDDPATRVSIILATARMRVIMDRPLLMARTPSKEVMFLHQDRHRRLRNSLEGIEWELNKISDGKDMRKALRLKCMNRKRIMQNV